MQGEAIRVLLIEGNPAEARLIEEMLLSADKAPRFKVAPVGRLDDALRHFQEKTFDAIILNLPLSDAQGPHSIKQARAAAPAAPLVVLAGAENEATALEAIREGALYLIKGAVTAPLLSNAVLYAIEYRKTEAALRDSEQRYRQLFEHANDAILVADEKGRYIDANRGAEELLGYRREELLKMALGDIAPHAAAPMGQDRREAFERLGKMSGEYTIRRKDGSLVPVEFSASRISPGRYLSILRDVTERRRTEAALRESEARFQYATRATNDAVWDWDLATNTVWWNESFKPLFSYRNADIEPKLEWWTERIHPDDRERVFAGIQEAIERNEHFWLDEYRFLRGDGLYATVFDRGYVVRDAEGRPVRMIGAMMDITERKEAEELLRAHARRQAILAELGQRALSGTPVQTLKEEAALWVTKTLELEYCKVLEPLPDGSGLLLSAGVGWKEGIVGRTKVDLWKNSQAAYALLCNGPVVVEDLRTETRFAPPPLLLEHGVVSGASVLILGRDHPLGVLGAHTTRRRTFNEEDIHFLQAVANILAAAIDRKKAEEQIEHQAYHDALTGLPNRLLFEDRLAVAAAQAHRSGEILAVLLIDLDRFKVINDTLGHPAGDALLRAAAGRFIGCLREGDTVARMGGDEFAVLLLNMESDEIVMQVADRIAASLKKSFHLDGSDLYITASIGVAVYPQAGLDAQTLLRNADIALYRAKEQGRNTLRYFSPTMNVKAFERLSLESSLRQALERQEFLLHFQPQVDLKRGEIVGFEALVRWHRPEIGLVSPGDFIPLAEETGLIIPLGEWVLRAACAQNKAWQEQGLPPVRIAVNLSARQFHKENLVDVIARVLAETGLEPRFLELELTESLLMGKERGTLEMLQALATMGISLSIDDFGTGYSSLSYLKRFPIGKLKVDQLFIRNLTTDHNDAVIAQTVVAMAHSLRLKAVAEGVETEAQLAFLRSIGCDEMQGYLFSRPLPAEGAVKLLIEGKRLPPA